MSAVGTGYYWVSINEERPIIAKWDSVTGCWYFFDGEWYDVDADVRILSERIQVPEGCRL